MVPAGGQTVERSRKRGRPDGVSRTPVRNGKRNTSDERSGPPRKKSGLRREEEEISELETRIALGAPERGSNPLAADLRQQGAADASPKVPGGTPGSGALEDKIRKPYAGCRLFADLPLSERTKRGLRESRFLSMTAIQRAAIPHALCGRDILGAAKTGSGKTLAFLVPLLEKLHRMRWGHADGVGAIVISPTRELASQIFLELNKVGRHHLFSGALLIGGRKGVEAEKDRAGQLNILVATPGRLLQHMDETPNFDCSNLQVLVLDEADRILDLGFSTTLNAILANLPRHTRQTMLFSATQTKSVRDLARLSLRDPEYLAVHADARAATPARLQQTVMVVRLDRKLDVLWSFLKAHSQAKVLVFLSSCKQVKFVFEAFKRLRPGLPLKVLHGRMKQMPRLAVFHDFCEAKHAALFATDVAARGLDFPAVDWVVQVDCPDDVATYIHRVGRTARYNAAGRSLLLLAPSEKAMLPLLEAAKVPFKITKVNPTKVLHIGPALAGLLSRDPSLKYLAQRAFVTYLRSIHIQGNKEVFDVSKLPVAEFSSSLGLPTAPRVRFLRKGQKEAGPGGIANARGFGGASGVLGEGEGGRGKRIVFGEASEGDEEEDGADEGFVRKSAAALWGEGGNEEASDGGNDEGESEGGSEGYEETETVAGGLWGRSGSGSGDGGNSSDSGSEGATDAGPPEDTGRRTGSKDAGGEEEEGENEEEAEEEEEEEEEFTMRVRPATQGSQDEVSGANVALDDGSKLPLKLSRKQLKKLKARPGRLAGTRLVFDDEGNALPPLEALARRQQQQQRAEVDEGEQEQLTDAAGNGLGASSAVEERFRRLRDEMKARDAEDRARERQRLREKRLKEKQKKRKGQGASQGEGAPPAVLFGREGGASASDSEGPEEGFYRDSPRLGAAHGSCATRNEGAGSFREGGEWTLRERNGQEDRARESNMMSEEALVLKMLAAKHP